MHSLRTTAFLAAFALLFVETLLAPATLPQTKHSHDDEDLNAIGHRNIGNGANLYSTRKEKDLGQALA